MAIWLILITSIALIIWAYLEEIKDAFSAYPDALILGEIAAMEGELDKVAEYIDPDKRLSAIYSAFLISDAYPGIFNDLRFAAELSNASAR